MRIGSGAAAVRLRAREPDPLSIPNRCDPRVGLAVHTRLATRGPGADGAVCASIEVRCGCHDGTPGRGPVAASASPVPNLTKRGVGIQLLTGVSVQDPETVLIEPPSLIFSAARPSELGSCIEFPDVGTGRSGFYRELQIRSGSIRQVSGGRPRWQGEDHTYERSAAPVALMPAKYIRPRSYRYRSIHADSSNSTTPLSPFYIRWCSTSDIRFEEGESSGWAGALPDRDWRALHDGQVAEPDLPFTGLREEAVKQFVDRGASAALDRAGHPADTCRRRRAQDAFRPALPGQQRGPTV